MREIKFRGLTRGIKNNYVWVYGFLAPFHNILTIKEKFGASYAIKRESVGEYTGYKDANGKEIYEGDIIRLEGVDDREIGSTWEHIGKIVYKRGAFFVCYFDYYADGDEELICDAQVEFGTVIGNIYENPELLEK